MKIDKDKLEALAALPDDAMWREIKGIANAHGLSLPQNTPPHAELEKIRSMCRGDTRFSMMQAMRILNDYKRGQKNG